MNAPMSAARRAALAAGHADGGAIAAGAEEVSKTLPADARGEVEIVNVAGTVEVSGWDRPEVQVDADLGSNVEKLDFRNDGQRTLIKVVLPQGGSSSGGSDLRDQSAPGRRPDHQHGERRTDDQGVRGSQRLQAVSGGIETEFGPGDLELKTVSGDIRARGDGKGLVRATDGERRYGNHQGRPGARCEHGVEAT